MNVTDLVIYITYNNHIVYISSVKASSMCRNEMEMLHTIRNFKTNHLEDMDLSLIKIHGIYDNSLDANKEAEKLIKEIDPLYQELFTCLPLIKTKEDFQYIIDMIIKKDKGMFVKDNKVYYDDRTKKYKLDDYSANLNLNRTVSFKKI